MSGTIEAQRKNGCCWSWYLVNAAGGDGFIPSGGMNKEMFVVTWLYFLQWLMTCPLYFSLKKSPSSFCVWTFGPRVSEAASGLIQHGPNDHKSTFHISEKWGRQAGIGLLRRTGGMFALFSGSLSLEGPGRLSFATQTVNFTDTSCPPGKKDD